MWVVPFRPLLEAMMAGISYRTLCSSMNNLDLEFLTVLIMKSWLSHKSSV